MSQPEDGLDPRIEAFNLHVQQLVKHFVHQEVQELEQRISDLEMAAARPHDHSPIILGGKTPPQDGPIF